MYYFYTSEGQTEGPVSMEVLEDYFSQKKINAKTMIFQEGGQEWEEFEKVVAKYRSNQLPSYLTGIKWIGIVALIVVIAAIIGYVGLVGLLLEIGVVCLLIIGAIRIYKMKPAATEKQKQTSQTTLIGYYFPMIGGFVAVAGIIGFFVCIANELVGLSIACLLSGFFSLMFFLWMGQIYDRIAECVHILKNMQDRNK